MSGKEVVVNDGEFVVSICDKIMKFKNERIKRMKGRGRYVMKNAEGNVSGSLNDSLYDLMNIVIFDCSQLIASNGLLEPSQ